MTVNEYLKLPYHYVFVKKSKGWSCEVQEFNKCVIKQNRTMRLAFLSARITMSILIEGLLERGIEIPLPEED